MSFSWKTFKHYYELSLRKINDEKSFYVHGKIVKYGPLSLGVLNNRTKLRYAMVWLVNWKWFDRIVMFLIILNSITLGIKDYTVPEELEMSIATNKLVKDIEPLFTVSFLIECVSKILAQGFIIGNTAYLSNSWNWLDFIVVVTSLL